MSLPFPSMNFVPLDVLTAEEQNQLVANIESLADGSGQDDGSITSAKLVEAFFRGRFQNDNNNVIGNTQQTGVLAQSGWVQILGNSTNTINQAVLFDVPYTTILWVQVGLLGAKSTPAAADITDLTVQLGGGFGWSVGADDITPTGFSVTFGRNTGVFSGSIYHAASWQALGIV